MRSALLKAATLALMFLHAATVARAGVDMRAASEQNGRIAVQLDSHYPPNFSPQLNFFVAIAPAGTYSVSFRSGPAPAPGKSAPLQGPAVLDTLVVSSPFVFRGTRIIWFKVEIPGGIVVSHVVIDYTPSPTTATAATVDPLVREVVINEVVFPYTAATCAPEPWFSRSAGWA